MSEKSAAAQSSGNPRALLVVPMWPAPSGNGVAMRAHLLLTALARDHRVDVWCIPVAGAQPGEPHRGAGITRGVVATLEVDPGWILASRAGAQTLRDLGRPAACRFVTHRAVAELRRAFGPFDYRCTVVYRSYLLPFAAAASADPAALGLRIVDLDDDEATTRRHLAGLAPAAAAADRHRLEAELFEGFESEHLPWAHHLLAAQEAHAGRIRRRWPDRPVDILPNAVHIPALLRQERPTTGEPRTLHLLFVGTLSYLPNRAAVTELASVITPRLRENGLKVRLRIIGRQPPPDIAELGQLDGVELVTDARDLGPHYAWTDQVVVPLRAGGGTRIKILEAFAHRVPVLATAMAADGLDVRDGRELLLAESAEELVAASRWLQRSPSVARDLAERAFHWVQRHHERALVAERLADRISRLASSPPPSQNR
ncbi:MAG: glycosyltransferase [Acidobacteriota bacterium]